MPRKKRSVRKPRAMPLGRFAARAPDDAAQCEQWSLAGDYDEHWRDLVTSGRTVDVPHCVFDESGARQMRRLARWLDAAAAWVEERR